MTRVAARRLSRLHKPSDLSLEAWQRELRRQFGREQVFLLKNIGGEPLLSDYHVTNPETGSVYRVSIRGARPGDNYCSCPDFATNTLGTCRRVEFVLGKFERRRGGRAALAQGFTPAYSEIVVAYGAKREVMFRPGTECPPSFRRLAARYFDRNQCLRAAAFARFESFLSAAATLEHDLRCYDDVPGLVAEVRDAASREREVALAFPRGTRDTAFRADELATLLDEVVEQPGAQVVVFSQWLRMHELLARRLASKPFERVLFLARCERPSWTASGSMTSAAPSSNW
jgi:hypothetical protein